MALRIIPLLQRNPQRLGADSLAPVKEAMHQVPAVRRVERPSLRLVSQRAQVLDGNFLCVLLVGPVRPGAVGPVACLVE